jgi:phosphate transport system protein
MPQPLRTAFDREFAEIQNDLVRMSQMVDRAIEQALQALYDSNQELAKAVVAQDQEVNELRFQIEEACLTLIATQQPAASDLRAVVGVMHVVVNLERIGDHAAGIGKVVGMMEGEVLFSDLKIIPQMGELARKMLADSFQAFLKRDAAWARQIAQQDEGMDELYQQAFHRLMETMVKTSAEITRSTYLMWIAHNLERIADRATNIAEQAIFKTTGRWEELNF